MLAADQRVRSSREFSRVVREGRRAGTATLVVHVMPGIEDGASRMGLIVGKSVGGAVVRNRVKRCLRAAARAKLGGLPAGSLLVIRALPAAATAGSARLGDDLDAALRRVRLT